MNARRMPAWAILPFRLSLLAFGVVAAATAPLIAERFPEDPIESFRQALQTENNKSISYKTRFDSDAAALDSALKYREARLKKAADSLRTASDLSRALLLIDWPRPPRSKIDRDAETRYDRGARDIERRIREEMTARFIRAVHDAFREPATTPDAVTRQIATADLVGETVAGAGDPLDDLLLALYRSLQPLAEELAKLTAAPRPAVREAAARALGQFPSSPKVATEALARMLTPDNPETTRRAAAEALSALALNASTNQPIRGSEPGVSARESRRSGKIFTLEEVVPLMKHLAKAAAVGLHDPSTAVRRASVNALRQGAEALAFEVRGLLPTSAKDIDLPPADRPWSKEEAARVAERHKEVADQEKQVLPALRAFRDQGAALLKAALDSDSEVRLNARRTLNALAQTRELLHKLHDSVPSRPADPGVDTARAPRLAPPPQVRLPVLPVSRRQEKGKAKAGEDKAKVEKDEPDRPADKEKDKGDEGDKDPDPIGTLLRQVGDALVREGYRDRNAVARRATHEAIEAMGPAGAAYIPQLVTSLKDPDLFVRWIAARALGKLAPRQAAEVVPALAGLLDDQDLDARIAVAKAIGQFGPDGASAVPALAQRLQKGDAEFRLAAMKALEGIGTSSATALPELARSLRDADPRVRGEAARILGRFGPRALAHVGELRRLSTGDPDSEVRRAASGAILAIVPE